MKHSLFSFSFNTRSTETPAANDYRKLITNDIAATVMTDDEDKFSNTIRSFCSETTVHGLSRTVASRSRKEKGFWLIVLLFCTGYALYQISGLIIIYLQYPVDVKLEFRHSNELEFPAITLCNNNPFKKSQMNLSMPTGKQDNHLKASLSKIGHGRITLQAIRDRYRYLLSALNDTVKKRIGHQAKDFILECLWKTTPCDHRNFTWNYNPVFGSCFTFGGKNHIRSTDSAGSQYGLSLTLDIESHEYMEYFAESPGVVVDVHNPHKYPFPEERGLMIAPARATTIGLSTSTILRLPLPYEGTDCGMAQSGTDIYNAAYSEIICKKTCIANEQSRICGCMSPVFPVKNICDTNNGTLMKCLKYVERMVGSSTIECNCIPACREIMYTPTLSSTEWPSPEFMPLLVQILNSYRRRSYTNLTIEDISKIRSTLVRVEIYYTSLNVRHIQQVPRYSAGDLIALIGGSLGLFVGASILSLLELFKFIFDLCAAWMWKKNATKPRRQGKNDMTMNDSSTG